MITDHIKIWELCLLELKETVGKDSLEIWFGQIVPVSFQNNILIAEATDALCIDHIYTYYNEQVSSALYNVVKNPVKLQLIVKSAKTVGRSTDGQESVYDHDAPVISNRVDPHLNRKFTFDNYVEGESNLLVRSAASAIAKNLGTSAFNPFVVFGDPGIGKTHIVQAIGNEVYDNCLDKNVIYVTGETFWTQYSTAASSGNRTEFVKFYQNVDLLIIDDIQSLIGREKSQWAFFSIFNHLIHENKQIVITSDKHPSELEEIHARLVSRFMSGLTAEVQKPGFEMRRVLVLENAKKHSLNLTDAVVDLIADKCSNNVREIEGIVIGLLASSLFVDKTLSEEFVCKYLGTEKKTRKVEHSVENIVSVVCKVLGVSLSDIKSPKKNREIAQARQIAMYCSKKYTQDSLSMIGAKIGGRNHSTVSYAHKTVGELSQTDKKIGEMLQLVEKKLNDVS